MSARFSHPRWSWFAVVAAVGAVTQAQPPKQIEEPKWLRLNVREVSTGVYSEGTFDTTVLTGSNSTVSYQRVFVGPLLGLNLDGSVYHSNLMRYSLLMDGSLGWGYQDTRSTTLEHRDELEYLGRFNCTTTILQQKPYATTIFGDYDHTYRDYDFFSRVIVDSWRYGLNSGYTEGPVPVRVSYWHRDEDISGYATPTSTRQDVFTAQADNDRDNGHSSALYTFNQYGSRAEVDTSSGTDNTINLSDTERFGSRKQYDLSASAGLSHRESDFQPSDEVTGALSLKGEYTPTLSSYCTASYDRYSTGPFDSDSLLGRAELRHQLYESLSSTLIGEGSLYSASDDLSTSETARYSGGLAESYAKRLSENSRLQVDNTVMLSHTDVTNSGNIGSVYDERHAFSTTGGAAPPDSFFLNQSRVIETTIVVTGDVNDPNGSFFNYQENLDYIIIRSGYLTLVERIAGSRIPRDRSVLVDYNYLTTPSGSYDTLSDSFHIRFSMWNNLWGVYARINMVANDAPPELLVQDLNIYTVGTDVNWRFLRAGAEYETYDSNLSDYRTTRLFESFMLRPDDASSLSLDFTESWTEYPDTEQTESRYTFITHYHRALTWRLGADVDGGVTHRTGLGVEQTLATCRPGINYVFGRTSIRASYDFEYELYRNSEERTKHMFVFRLRRTF